MGYSSKLRGAVCFAALVVGGAANADVTAQQVWDSWKSQMSMYPETALTTTSEDMSGDTLTVTGLSVKTTSPEMSTEVAIDQMTFEEQGDGSVRITMSESYPMTFTAQSGAVITVDTTYSGLEMVVTGDDTELNYDVSADTAKLALRDVVDGDVTFTGNAILMVNDMTGSYSTSETETNNIAYDIDIASIDLLVDVAKRHLMRQLSKLVPPHQKATTLGNTHTHTCLARKKPQHSPQGKAKQFIQEDRFFEKVGV